MTNYVVHYKNGVTLVINKELYESRCFSGLPNAFLRFVESMGEWTLMEKRD